MAQKRVTAQGFRLLDFFVYNYEVAQNCASPFINESSNRDVYIIGSEARRNRQAPFRLMHEPCFIWT